MSLVRGVREIGVEPVTYTSSNRSAFRRQFMAEAFGAWVESLSKQARSLTRSRSLDWARRRAGLNPPMRYLLAYRNSV